MFATHVRLVCSSRLYLAPLCAPNQLHGGLSYSLLLFHLPLCAPNQLHGGLSYSLLLFICRFEWAILRQHKNYNRQLDQEEFMADLKADGYIAPDTNMKGGAYGRSVTVCCYVLQTSSWLYLAL